MGRKIVVDPAQLKTAGNKMSEQADAYKAQYDQLFVEVRGMGANWQGKDNIAFVKQIEGFEDDFKTMFELLKKYSEFLVTSSGIYQDVQDDRVTQAGRLTN